VLAPFQLVFVQRGLLEVVLLSVAAGILGVWIVMRGLAFFSHAVGTAAFPGLVLADGLGFAAPLGAFAAALLFAFGVERIARRERAGYDALTALVLIAALAGGVVLASDVFHSGGNVDSLLFGSLLVVGTRDLVLAAAVSVLVLIASRLVGPRWLVAGFDPSAARSMGLRSGAPDAVLLLLVTSAVVASLSAIGALLATALLVVPAATTRLWTSHLGRWQLGSVALVLAEGTLGLWLSVRTNTPPGATIAVIGGAAFAVSALVQHVRPLARGRGALAGAALAVVALLVVGCGGGSGSSVSAAATGAGGASGVARITVVATTTQIGDFVRNVGGAAVDVHQILAPNSDPHDYEPRPADVEAAASGKVVFENGDNLDKWMAMIVSAAGGSPTIVDLGAAVPTKLPGESSGPEASTYDPHWWHDPQNAEAAVGAIRDALTKANPAAKATYDANATAYLAKLKALDAAITACFAAVPQADRKLVSDHDAFGYFAKRYGITIVGAVIPSQTTQAQASAGDVAKLVAQIKREGVKAVFPESSLNPKLAQQIADETGARADFTLYGDTLGPSGSPGATYLTMEQANADAMVQGFSGGRARCTISEIG
jgi:ABC-type Zn uptake system ZnuABC Zn-binding protein ZnuA/ABC-type Mn2+/Zn2+ transport system permease subunit